jgi:flavodoxin
MVVMLLDRRSFLRATVALGATGLASALAGCAPAGPTSIEASRSPTPKGTDVPETTGTRTLLVYFSRAGENYHYGDRIDLEVGNTQVAAEMIAGAIPVDTYRIEAADPYPDDYEATVERNVREQDADARPAISGTLPSLDGYDTILLGSPIWNVQAPMIMRTFVDSVDLVGKTIQPFVTYAVSGMGTVRSDYQDMCPDSTVGDGLAIRGEEVGDAQPDIDRWLQGIGLLA